MVRTCVGYAGGTRPSPTYHDLGDHAETLEIVFDPTRVSYEQLLDLFWESHDPRRPTWSRQYMSAIFYHDEEQRRLAHETHERLASAAGTRMHTEITPASGFHPAEDYHQKYYLRQVPELIADLRAAYPRSADLVRSTAAARVNGYIGGFGTPAELEKEIDRLGLTPAGRARLQAIAATYR